jgi:hypothetical protein
MLLEQLGLADVAGETSVLSCRDISFILRTLAPFLAAVEIHPHRRRVEPDASNTRFDFLIMRPATQPTTDALAALRTCRNSPPSINASSVGHSRGQR